MTPSGPPGRRRAQRRRLLRAFSAHGAAGDRPVIEAIVRRHVERWPHGGRSRTLPATRAPAFEVVVRHATGLLDVELDELERRLQRLLKGQARLAVSGGTLSRPRLGLDPQAALGRRLAALDAVLSAGMDGPHRTAARSPRSSATVTSARCHTTRPCTSCARSRSSATRPPERLLHLLAHHPVAAERARAATVSGDDATVRSWVQEALRVHPPVIDAIREVAEDMEIGGYVVPARTIVMAAPLLVHTRADTYAQPYVFQPERFVDRRPDPAAWIPFGGGVRRCLGTALAQETLQARSSVRCWSATARVRTALDRSGPACPGRRSSRDAAAESLSSSATIEPPALALTSRGALQVRLAEARRSALPRPPLPPSAAARPRDRPRRAPAAAAAYAGHG